MNYQVLVLDLDGTLTNSEKKISLKTKKALIQIQTQGKILALASGRPTIGMLSLAQELELSQHGGYLLSFNGARIMDCRTGDIIYNRTLLPDLAKTLHRFVKKYKKEGADLVGYLPDCIVSGIQSNEYSQIEAKINRCPLRQAEDFPAMFQEPVNKFLITGAPELIPVIMEDLDHSFHSAVSAYRSEPYFLEIMPQNVDKAHSLQKLLNSIGLTAEEMICCGDGYNDLTMIEYAGLGVAMANAQPAVLEKADFVTKSNDEDGILHVIERFMKV